MREARSRTMATKTVLVLAIFLACGSPVFPQEKDPAAGSPDLSQSAQPPERVSRLQGTAFLDRNEDVIGATVVVHAMGDRSVIYLTSTDEHGRFKIEGLPDGNYKVRVHRHGVETMVKDNVTVRFPFRAVVELNMEQVEKGPILPTGGVHDIDVPSKMVSLSGIARTPRGQPMGEVKLRIVKTDGSADPRMATTAEDGTFRIDGIAAGQWRLTVVGVGMLPIRTWIYLVDDEKLDIHLVLQPASYEPSPLELMPIEEPIPPAGMADIIKKG